VRPSKIISGATVRHNSDERQRQLHVPSPESIIYRVDPVASSMQGFLRGAGEIMPDQANRQRGTSLFARGLLCQRFLRCAA